MNNDRYNFTAATAKLSESISLKTRVSLVCMHSASGRKREAALWGIQWVLVAEFVGVTEHGRKKEKNRRKKQKTAMDRVTIITK